MIKSWSEQWFEINGPQYHIARHNDKSGIELRNWLEKANAVPPWQVDDEGVYGMYAKQIQEAIARFKLTTEQARDGMRVFAEHIDEFYIDTGVNPHIDIEGLLNLLEEEVE